MATSRAAEKRKVVSAKNRASSHKVGFDVSTLNVPPGTNFYKIKTGKATIEIIPFTLSKRIKDFTEDIRKLACGESAGSPGELYYEQTFWQHYKVGPEDKNVVCPKKTFGKACPICEHRAFLMKDPGSDQEAVKELIPKERQVFWIVNHDEVAKGPQLMEMSFHLFGKLLDTRINNDDKDGSRGYFADPVQGSTLKLEISDKTMGGGKPFPEVSSIDFIHPRKKALKPEWLKVASLTDMVKEIPYAELKAIFLQDDGEGAAPAEDPIEPETLAGDDSESQVNDPPEDPETAEPPTPEVGLEVCFTYKDEELKGTISKINAPKKLVMVTVEGQAKDSVVAFADLRLPVEEDAGDWGEKAGGTEAATEDDGWGEETPAEAPAEDGWGDDTPAEAEAPEDTWDDTPTEPPAKASAAKKPAAGKPPAGKKPAGKK